MANILTWILVAFFGIIFVAGIVGLVQFIIIRYRREEEGDIFLLPPSKDGSPPIELRAQRDYRYKDADVDPYKD